MPILLITLLTLVTLAAEEGVVVQDLKQDPALVLSDPAAVAVLREVLQAGKAPRHSAELLDHGLHIRTGAACRFSGRIAGKDWNSGGLLGVHGAGTVLDFAGTWQGDQGAALPCLAITEGARVVVGGDAHIDLVLAGSFFTRQLWCWGDGSGELELAEDFVAERSASGTVPDACGTIRLAGVTLISHHEQSLPFNWRDDGRGGIYPNGHVVLEQAPGTSWSIRSRVQRYGAQIDCAVDCRIDCQAPLVHSGWRRDCLPLAEGGGFTSSGAFRTTRPEVTVTKTGPAMLALEGQQGWQAGSRLIVAEGLLRLATDPASGERLGEAWGDHLDLVVAPGASVHLCAARIRLRRLEVQAGGRCVVAPETELLVAEQVLGAGAAIVREE